MGIPVASPTKTSCATPQPVPKGKDLGNAFCLNHGYIYGAAARVNLAFVPNCWTITKYVSGSFVVSPPTINKVGLLQALSCLRKSAVRLGFRCSCIRVLACLHAVALHHSSWCFSASHLLTSCVTDLFEIPITGSRTVGFCFVASLASLSTILLPMIPLCPGVQTNVTWLSSASLFNASYHSHTSIEVVTDLSSVVMAVLLSEQMWMFLPRP